MLDKLKELLEYGKEKTDFIEINVSDLKKNKLIIEKNILKSNSYSDLRNLFVRVWIGKKQGIASSSVLNKDVIDKAIESARNNQEKDFFYGLPKKQEYKKINGLYDKNLEDCEERLMEILDIFLDQFKKRKSYISEAHLNSGISNNYLINSEGIEAEEKSSFINLDVESVVKNKEGFSVSDDISSRRLFSLNNVENFGKNLADETELFLKARRLSEFKIPEIVVLESYALYGLLEDAFLSNFNAESILKGASILQGKENQKIFSDKLILRDDALLESGMSSTSFDDEGTVTRTTTLIDKGILKSFIYDYNTALHLKKQPTGNAQSDSIGFNNIMIKPGNKEIEQEIDNALIIKRILGSHTSNEFTTDFSVNSILSYYLKNGEKIPVKDFMISGNFLNMLNNIEAIDKRIINKGNYYCPAIGFKEVKIKAF